MFYTRSSLQDDLEQPWGREATAAMKPRVELGQGLARHCESCVGQSPVGSTRCVPCPAPRAGSWTEAAELLRGLLCKQHMCGQVLGGGGRMH